MSQIRWIRLSGLLGVLFGLFAGVGWYLMGGPTLFVLLHAGLAAVGVCGWSWGQWLVRRDRSARLSPFFWPRRLVWAGVSILGVVVVMLSGRKVWLDLTPDQVHSLTPASLAVLRTVSQPVEVVVNLSARRETAALAVLERYRRASDLIQIRGWGDPEHATAEVALPGEGVLLRMGERTEFLSSVTEEAVTNALGRLRLTTPKRVYILAGHGEPALDDSGPAGFAQLAAVLRQERYQPRRLVLVSTLAIPTDADLLVVPSGTTAPLVEEQDEVARYLRSGGRVLFFLSSAQATVWQELFAELGIVWDTQWRTQRVAARPVIGHPLAQVVPRNSVALLSGFFPLRVWGELPQGAEVRPALVSDESAQLSPALAPALAAARASGQGFLIFGITGEYPAPQAPTPTRLAIFGSQGFVTNAGLSRLANQDVVVGCMRWLTQDAGGVRIVRQTRTPTQMIVAPESLEDTFVLLVLFPPELILVLSLIMLWRRGRI